MTRIARIVAIVIVAAGCGASQPPAKASSGSNAGGDPAAGGVGQVCGTRGATPCTADLFCNFVEAEECGATDKGGHCAAKPAACPRIASPVCGCNNKNYGNGCEASAAGVGVKHAGQCLIDI